jgi:hypothetical protein
MYTFIVCVCQTHTVCVCERGTGCVSQPLEDRGVRVSPIRPMTPHRESGWLRIDEWISGSLARRIIRHTHMIEWNRIAGIERDTERVESEMDSRMNERSTRHTHSENKDRETVCDRVTSQTDKTDKQTDNTNTRIAATRCDVSLCFCVLCESVSGFVRTA